jgi:hypothetical protein
MSHAVFFEPENRLAKAISTPGGKYVDTAIIDADELIAQAADECVEQIDRALEQVYRLSERANAHLEVLYKTVREVAGLAGTCGLADLGAAALSFCNLLDQAHQSGRLSGDRVQVHLGVMRLLRLPDRFTESERREILQNLQAVIDKGQAELA